MQLGFADGWKLSTDESIRHSIVLPPLNCFLLQEHDRIGVEFGVTAYESVATVFWHAITRNQGAVALYGPAELRTKILCQRPARSRLADELTGRPSIHRYIYRH